jgi:tetratricopeptide (TPR) repeat protein
MEISLQIGDRTSEAFAAVMQGKIALNRGEFDEAVASHKRARIAAEATGIPYIMAVGACTSGTCFRRIGGPLMARAKSLHDETLEMLEMPTGKVHGAWIWSEIGQCALQSGDQTKAEHLFRLALDEHTATMWLLRPSALAGLVELSLERDDLETALDVFVELKEYVTTRKMLDHYIDVELLGARLAARQGHYEKALRDSERTKTIALSQNLLRILIDVYLLQIGIHGDRGDIEAASIATEEARRVAADIGAGIRSEELREAFVSEMASRLG